MTEIPQMLLDVMNSKPRFSQDSFLKTRRPRWAEIEYEPSDCDVVVAIGCYDGIVFPEHLQQWCRENQNDTAKVICCEYAFDFILPREMEQYFVLRLSSAEHATLCLLHWAGDGVVLCQNPHRRYAEFMNWPAAFKSLVEREYFDVLLKHPAYAADLIMLAKAHQHMRI